jgi:hypothetical protein
VVFGGGRRSRRWQGGEGATRKFEQVNNRYYASLDGIRQLRLSPDGSETQFDGGWKSRGQLTCDAPEDARVDRRTLCVLPCKRSGEIPPTLRPPNFDFCNAESASVF